MKTVVEAPHGCKGVWVYPLYYFLSIFFVYFPMLFLPTPKKRNTEAQESRTERGCVDGIKQRLSRTSILVRFAFWFFPFLPPLSFIQHSSSFPYHFFFLPLSRSTSLSSWRRLSCRLHRLPEQWQPSQPSYWFPLACVALYSVVLQQVWSVSTMV